MMSNAEAAAICTDLGHLPKGIEMKQNPERHRFHCQCGYVCTNRRTKADAVQAGIHHMRSVALDARKNGYVPKNVAAVG